MDRTDIKEMLHRAAEAAVSLQMISDEIVSQVLREVASGLRGSDNHGCKCG